MRERLASQDEDEAARAAQDLAALDGGDSIALGRHRLSLHGDVVRMEYHGALDLGEAVHLHAIMEQLLAQRRRVFFLTLVCEEAPATDEARKYVIGWNRTYCAISGAAVVGTRSAVTRAVGSLLVRAINLGRPEPLLLVFLKTEEEAHAYFARHRRDPAPPRPADGRHRREPLSAR
jgi:hypothetical protein